MMMKNEHDDAQRNEKKFHFRKVLIGSVVLTIMLIVAVVTGFHQGTSPGHNSNLVSRKEKEMKNGYAPGKINLPHGVVSDIFDGEKIESPNVLFKYYVMIFNRDDMSHPLCGGTLFRMDVVLTAGHCLGKERGVGYEDVSKLLVIAGFEGIGTHTNNMGPRYQPIGARFIIKHNSYNWIGFGNDIGLIKLEEPFQDDGGRVDVATLAPSDTEYPAKRKVELLGTGPIAPGEYPDHLRRGWAWGTSFAECRAQYPQALGGRDFCVFDKLDHWGICKGDSGSPIIDYQTRQVIGVITMGSPTCEEPSIGVGAFIPEYEEWISTTRKAIDKGTVTGGAWLRDD